MFSRKADLEINEILNPAMLWCKSGHEVPPGMRMWTVKGKTLDKSRWGNYCDLCVSGAQKLAAQRRKQEETSEEVESPPAFLLEYDPRKLKRDLRSLGFQGIVEEDETEEAPEPWEAFVEQCGK